MNNFREWPQNKFPCKVTRKGFVSHARSLISVTFKKSFNFLIFHPSEHYGRFMTLFFNHRVSPWNPKIIMNFLFAQYPSHWFKTRVEGEINDFVDFFCMLNLSLNGWKSPQRNLIFNFHPDDNDFINIAPKNVAR